MNSLKLFSTLFGTLALSLILALPMRAQSRASKVIVTGQVTATDDKQPMIGVSVVVVETMQGTTTDLDGRYSIEAATGQTLSFSYLGYTETTHKIASGEANQTLDIALAPTWS